MKAMVAQSRQCLIILCIYLQVHDKSPRNRYQSRGLLHHYIITPPLDGTPRFTLYFQRSALHTLIGKLWGWSTALNWVVSQDSSLACWAVHQRVWRPTRVWTLRPLRMWCHQWTFTLSLGTGRSLSFYLFLKTTFSSFSNMHASSLPWNGQLNQSFVVLSSGKGSLSLPHNAFSNLQEGDVLAGIQPSTSLRQCYIGWTMCKQMQNIWSF
jgi:hypothetical protein